MEAPEKGLEVVRAENGGLEFLASTRCHPPSAVKSLAHVDPTPAARHAKGLKPVHQKLCL